jgi:hypothetical protein
MRNVRFWLPFFRNIAETGGMFVVSSVESEEELVASLEALFS